MGKSTIYKWSFSIAMLNYQRVSRLARNAEQEYWQCIGNEKLCWFIFWLTVLGAGKVELGVAVESIETMVNMGVPYAHQQSTRGYSFTHNSRYFTMRVWIPCISKMSSHQGLHRMWKTHQTFRFLGFLHGLNPQLFVCVPHGKPNWAMKNTTIPSHEILVG